MLARYAVLDPAHYVSPDVFAAERERIFARSWLYAGPAGAFHAEPRAVGAPWSTAVLSCRDGTWRAECDGRPASVSLCGGLVFWSRTPAVPLAEYLAPFQDTLRVMAEGLAVPDFSLRREIGANWKLLAENTLDDYHLAATHARTLYPSMLNEGERRVALDRQGPHSAWRNALNAADGAFWGRAARRLGMPAGSDAGAYRHLFIFPNFYLASFNGTAFILHRLDPLDAERTVLEMTFCIPAAPGSAAALKRAVLADFAAKAEAVLAEDAAVCEAVQQGQRFAVHPGLLGLYEQRVGDFQDAVLEALAR